jgi:hypothetical protein
LAAPAVEPPPVANRMEMLSQKMKMRGYDFGLRREVDGLKASTIRDRQKYISAAIKAGVIVKQTYCAEYAYNIIISISSTERESM